MEFSKIIPSKKRSPLAKKGFGIAILKEGNLTVKIFSNSRCITTVGLVDGGIGCETEESNRKNKIGYSTATRRVDDGDLPPNLTAKGYTFSIPAEKRSEDEYVFMFANARMSGYVGKKEQKEANKCQKTKQK